MIVFVVEYVNNLNKRFSVIQGNFQVLVNMKLLKIKELKNPYFLVFLTATVHIRFGQNFFVLSLAHRRSE